MTDKAQEVLTLRKQGIGYKKIGKLLNVSEDNVIKILIENGIVDHIKMPPIEIVEEIIFKYVNEFKGRNQIAKELSIGPKNVINVLRVYGVEIRPTAYHSKHAVKINHSYFDRIDCEHKAYWLGMLFADGYNNEKFYQVELTLKAEDGYMLELFKKDLNCDYRIITKKVILNDKIFYSKRLIIYSKQISQRLAQLGCVQNKSLILKFPSLTDIPFDYLKHFMRGYLDGDGMISFTSNSQKLGVTGTEDFVLKYIEILKLCSHCETKGFFRPDGKAITWLCSSKIDIAKIGNWLYRYSTIFLERKHNNYIQILNTINKNYLCRSKINTTEILEILEWNKAGKP